VKIKRRNFIIPKHGKILNVLTTCQNL